MKDKKRNIFIGGAWPYANSTLHVGHLAALLGGDVLARYFRLKGENVVYVSGSDCHGTPITLRAIKEGKEPRMIAKHFHDAFVNLFNLLNFEYDFYGETSAPYHHEEVKKLLLTLEKNGYIFEKEEDQIYCNTCEKFLNDREIVFTCPSCGKQAKGEGCDCKHQPTLEELLSGNCVLCGSKVTTKKDKNLYFKLSAFQKQIEEYVDNNKDRWRLNAVNETKKYLNQGLIDRAITRDLDWGIEVPFKGYEHKRIYVWIEAVLGYLSTCKKYCQDNNLDWNDFLKEDKNDLYYMVHGKDNIVFHTIIFPALLLGLNEGYRLPTDIVSSEFMTLDGDKISKSTGNYKETDEIVAYGSSDTLRFYIMGYGPEKKDSDFSLKDYATIHNNEIVNKFGNFINRTLKFKGINKIEVNVLDPLIRTRIEETYDQVSTNIEKYEFREAARSALHLVEFANKYYDDSKPWILFKEDIDKFNEVIYNCAVIIANLANIFLPFMPETSKKIARLLNLELSFEFTSLDNDITLDNIEALFTRIKI